MGWNTAVVLAEGTSSETVRSSLPEGFVLTTTVLDWWDASSGRLAPNLALANYQGWAVLFDPGAGVALDERVLAALSQSGRALACLMNSVATVYGFCYFAEGHLKRKVIRLDYAVIEEAGAPLHEEHDLRWDDEEETVMEIAARLTGLNPSDPTLFDSIPFTLIRA